MRPLFRPLVIVLLPLLVFQIGHSDRSAPAADCIADECVYLPLVVGKGANSNGTPTATPTATTTPTVTPTPQPRALFERMLALDGFDDYATAPDQASLDLGTRNQGDFTIETFFYTPSLANVSVDMLFYKAGAYELHVDYYTSADDIVTFCVQSAPGTQRCAFYSKPIAVGWHHVAAVFDNTAADDQLLVYLDGALGASYTTPKIMSVDSPLIVGATDTGNHPAQGRLDEARISDVMRYSGASYTVPTQPFKPDTNTLALWHFDEAINATVFGDSSGNGNTLTGHNHAHIAGP
jgi:hypothetical protein